MKKFKGKKYNGLFYRNISYKKVNADLTDVLEGDIFLNKKGDMLVYIEGYFKLSANDDSNYLSNKELRKKFINYGLKLRNENI